MSYIWPLDGKISQGFGRPALAVEPTMWLAPDESRCRPTKFAGARKYEDVHPGIDIICPIGTPILAPDDGVVVDVGTFNVFFNGAWRRELYAMFRFERGEGEQALLEVGHLSRVRDEGDRVERGKPWAWSGNSGASTGPHAHLEVRTGPAGQPAWRSWEWFRENPKRYLEEE